MKVRYRKGIAIYPGPESGAGVREDAGEALTGETVGQPLSREIGILERRRRYPRRKATPWTALSEAVQPRTERSCRLQHQSNDRPLRCDIYASDPPEYRQRKPQAPTSVGI